MFVIVALTLLILLIYFVWNRLYSRKKVNSLPGPVRLPLIGSLYYFRQAISKDFLNTMLHLCENYSSPFQIRIFHKLIVTIYEPDQIKTVLKNHSCLDKSIIYKVMEPMFGTGLVTAPYSHMWVKNRNMTAATVNATMLKEFFNTFFRESLIMTEELQNICHNGNEIDYFEHLQRCTLKISFDTMLGIQMETNIINKIIKALQRYKDIIKYRFGNVFLFTDFIFNLSSLEREQRDITTFGQSIFDMVIQKWTEELNTTTANSDKDYNRFLDVLMTAPDGKFTEKDIFYNIATMLLASSDTTASTLYFAILMLANFPEIQEKVHKELLEIYGTEFPRDKPIKEEDLQHMHYLNCVIKETLRLFPTIPLIGRLVTEDIKIGNYVIPKGADIIVSFIKMNRNEAYWPSPLKFDPERFSTTNNQDSRSNYFVPFSDGKRSCIGTRYAYKALTTILATLFRVLKFEISETINIENIELTSDITLTTLKQFKLKIIKRSI